MNALAIGNQLINAIAAAVDENPVQFLYEADLQAFSLAFVRGLTDTKPVTVGAQRRSAFGLPEQIAVAGAYAEFPYRTRFDLASIDIRQWIPENLPWSQPCNFACEFKIAWDPSTRARQIAGWKSDIEKLKAHWQSVNVDKEDPGVTELGIALLVMTGAKRRSARLPAELKAASSMDTPGIYAVVVSLDGRTEFFTS